MSCSADAAFGTSTANPMSVDGTSCWDVTALAAELLANQLKNPDFGADVSDDTSWMNHTSRLCEARTVFNKTLGCAADATGCQYYRTGYDPVFEVVPPKAMLSMCMNIFSLATCFLVIVAFLNQPKCRVFPQNLIMHLIIFTTPPHFIQLYSAVVGYKIFSDYNACDGTITNYGITDGACYAQGFLMPGFANCSMIMSTIITYNLNKTITGSHKNQTSMRQLKKYSNMQVAVSYLPLILVAIGFVWSQPGVYTVYCCMAFELWPRALYYVPMLIGCVYGVWLTIPLMSVMWKNRKKVKVSMKVEIDHFTGKKKIVGVFEKSKTGLDYDVLVKFTGYAFVYLTTTGLASTKRLQHTFNFESYYETPDAGAVGATEFIIGSYGGMLGWVLCFKVIKSYWSELLKKHGVLNAKEALPETAMSKGEQSVVDSASDLQDKSGGKVYPEGDDSVVSTAGGQGSTVAGSSSMGTVTELTTNNTGNSSTNNSTTNSTSQGGSSSAAYTAGSTAESSAYTQESTAEYTTASSVDTPASAVSSVEQV